MNTFTFSHALLTHTLIVFHSLGIQSAKMDSGFDNEPEEKSLYMGIDLGTTSVKVVLVGIDGNPVASVSKATDACLESDIGSSGFEQHPEKILQTVMDLTVPMMKQYSGSIKGLDDLLFFTSILIKHESCVSVTLFIFSKATKSRRFMKVWLKASFGLTQNMTKPDF